MVFACCKNTNVAVIESANDPKAYAGFVLSEERNPNVSVKSTSESFDAIKTIDTDDILSQYMRFTSENQSDDNNNSKAYDAEEYVRTRRSQNDDGFQGDTLMGSVAKTASLDSSDDDITTVYEEPLKSKPFNRQVSIQGSVVSAVKSMKTSIVSRARSFKDYVLPGEDISPKDSLYVLVPNVPQRGYEMQQVNYEDYALVCEKPLSKGASVWYRCNGDHTFKWYIPAIVQDYVLKENQVTGYVLKVESEDKMMASNEKTVINTLKNADPAHTMLRWDECIPECPMTIKKRNEIALDSACELQYGYRPELWGLTLEQIQEIKAHKRYKPWMSLGDIVEKIIAPQTKGTGMGYAVLINKNEPKKVHTMVSYSSHENFDEFCSILEKSKVEGPYWISAFSMNKNEFTKFQVKIDIFKRVLKQSSTVLAVITDSVDVYSSLSTIYEMFLAISSDKTIRFLNYSGGMLSYDYGDKTICSLSAQCVEDTERESLHSEIRKSGGFFLVDDTIMWARIKALIDEIELLKAKEQSESRLAKPIGSCSASNVLVKQNAKIAAAIQTWQKLKDSRNPNDELQIEKIDSLTAEFTVPNNAESGEELGFSYNEIFRTVRIPKGEQGKRIRVKFRQEPTKQNGEEDPALAFCGVNCY